MFRRIARKRTLALAVVLSLIVAAVAVGFYLLSVGQGSGSATLGSAPTGHVTLNVSFADGLSPGQSEGVTVTATNDTPNEAVVNSLALASITTSDESDCPASWFSYDPPSAASMGPALTLNPGNRNVPVGNGPAQEGTLSFVDSGTNQGGCAGQSVVLSLTSN